MVTSGELLPGGAKLVHALLIRPIGRSPERVRVLAATLVPEHCRSGHCGDFCRWSHCVSSARGQRNCWRLLKVCRPSKSVKARFVTKDGGRADSEPKPSESLPPRAQRYPVFRRFNSRCTNGSLQGLGDFRSAPFFFDHSFQSAQIFFSPRATNYCFLLRHSSVPCFENRAFITANFVCNVPSTLGRISLTRLNFRAGLK